MSDQKQGSKPATPPTVITLVIAVLLILAIAAGIAVVLSSRPVPVQIQVIPPPATATIRPVPTLTPAPMQIYVTGAVARPGTIVQLLALSRVQDAIAAAGGALPQADLARVNLAGVLHDGDQVHVPAVGEAEMALATRPGGPVIYVNTASADELEALPGVGPALAVAIITYRDTYGPFRTFDDLDAVDGIGPGLIERWQDMIAFD